MELVLKQTSVRYGDSGGGRRAGLLSRGWGWSASSQALKPCFNGRSCVHVEKEHTVPGLGPTASGIRLRYTDNLNR